jgi:hypothetical protein
MAGLRHMDRRDQRAHRPELTVMRRSIDDFPMLAVPIGYHFQSPLIPSPLIGVEN